MKTLAEAYALRHPEKSDHFHRALFRSSLHFTGWLLYPVLAHTAYFEIDRELINDCGRARSMTELREAIEDYAFHPRNGGILRNWFRVRISTRKLRHVAHKYFAFAAAAQPTATAKGLTIEAHSPAPLPIRRSTLNV